MAFTCGEVGHERLVIEAYLIRKIAFHAVQGGRSFDEMLAIACSRTDIGFWMP